MEKMEKIQKYENTKRQKYKTQNANTKYRLQKNVKNHPSYKKWLLPCINCH